MSIELHELEDWDEHEMKAIVACRKGRDPHDFGYMSTSEWFTLALGLGRHDLLEGRLIFDAWDRLDDRQKAIVRTSLATPGRKSKK